MPPPFCRVDFGLLGDTPDPVHARVIRRAFSHEICIVQFRDRNMSAKTFRSDMPIRVTWGLHPRYREEFVGYVHHVRNDVRYEKGSSRLPVIEAVCVGATRVLRDESPRNWGRTRSDLVAGELTRSFRLGIDADRSTTVHDGLMQSAQSGWAFLISLAQSEGFHLSATKTRVHFWDLGRHLTRTVNFAPVFDNNRGEIERFQPISGEMNPTDDEAREQTVYALGLTGTGGNFSGRMSGYSDRYIPVTQSLTANLRPVAKYARVVDQTPATTAVDARHAAEALARKSDRVYHAKASLAAFPPLRPGDPLVLDNYGVRQSGVWVTDAVEFTLSKERLTAQVEISRALAEDDGFRPRTPRGKSPDRRPVSSALVNGAWVDRLSR